MHLYFVKQNQFSQLKLLLLQIHITMLFLFYSLHFMNTGHGIILQLSKEIEDMPQPSAM